MLFTYASSFGIVKMKSGNDVISLWAQFSLK